MSEQLGQMDAPQIPRNTPADLGHQLEHIPLTGSISQGLGLLLRAHRYAEAVGRDDWDFAVEIDRLRELGLVDCDFRLLAILKLTEHAQEITRVEDDGREFRPVGNLSFPAGSCFILTPGGVRLAESEPSGTEAAGTLESDQPAEVDREHLKPSWHAETRTLLFSGQMVKHFKWPAVNQERVLAAFEEDGWPARIDDPLPPEARIDPKRRLHDTIKNLNKNQQTRMVHFRGDGTGEGVIWELSQSPSAG